MTAAAFRQPIPDEPGEDLRPDPDAIATVASLIGALRLYRIWAGNVSFRDLAQRCEGRASASTLNLLVKQEKLPRLELVRDFLLACGVEDGYRERFENAWRRVALAVSAAAQQPAG